MQREKLLRHDQTTDGGGRIAVLVSKSVSSNKYLIAVASNQIPGGKHVESLTAELHDWRRYLHNDNSVSAEQTAPAQLGAVCIKI